MQVQIQAEKEFGSSVESKLHEQELQERQSSAVPEHLIKLDQVAQISEKSKCKLLKSGRFTQAHHFRNRLNIQIASTNFESMKILLQYGDFMLEISVIYTQINQKIFLQENTTNGSFGVVKFAKFEGQSYAVKGVNFEYNQDGINIENVYKEYFLCSMADVLEVGPRVFPLFGFDILLTKKMAFFVMEECGPVKFQKKGFLMQQMLQSLQLMHSLNFVHIDIKPANLAFSNRLKKNVFIDFGLSKIINEKPGEKTRTRFEGTLSFCSVEMKKCYFLSTSKFVDLYENDVCCLKKTIQEIQSPVSSGNFTQKSRSEESEQNNPFEFFNQLVTLLRLKYYAQREDLKQVLGILEISKSIKKSVHQFFSAGQLPKVIWQNSEVQQRLNVLKKEMFNQKTQSKVDIMLNGFFCEDQRSRAAEKIIPISQILESKSEFLNKYLSKPHLCLKLFVFFQPFAKNSFYIEKKSKLQRIIVDRIYELKQTRITGTVFFSEKVRFTLIYFYENLKGLNNLQALLYLRILFIGVQDWTYFEELQNEILLFIKHPFLKMLKIAEFTLFSVTLSQDFESERKQRFLQLIQNISISDPREQQIKYFLEIIMTVSNLAGENLQSKISLVKLLKQIDSKCGSSEEKQSIYLIHYIFIELCKLHYSPFYEAPKGLALGIYSRFFITLKVSLNDLEQKESNLFHPIHRQLKRQFSLESSKTQVKTAIHNLIQVSKQTNEFIKVVINKIMHFDFVEKRIAYYFVEKIREISLDKRLAQVCTLSKMFYAIHYCFKFICKNQVRAVGQEKIRQEEKASLINAMLEIFNKTMEVQEVKRIVESSKELQIHAMTIQAKFGFQNGKTAQEMEPQIRAILSLFEPLPYKFHLIFLNFLPLFGYLQPQIHGYEDHYSKQILLYIAEQHLAKKHFYLFQIFRPILVDFIRIKNEQNREKQNLDMIFSLMEDLRNENEVLNAKISNRTFQSTVEIFCTTLTIERLITVYSAIKLNKLEFECRFYAFFVFEVFYLVKDRINQAEQRRQVTRTTLCLNSMPPIYQINVKSTLLSLYKSLFIFKSKRKAFTCRRLEIRNADENRLRVIIKQMKNKVQKITKKNIEEVISKLNSRVSSLKRVHSGKNQEALPQYRRLYYSYKF